MAIKRIPIEYFMKELVAAEARDDGYIMGAKGQDPKKWSKNSWYFTQYKDRDNYTAAQEKKALYWRANADRVWDCNGLAEGIYEDFTSVNINTKARYNYSGWCSTKGSGLVPTKHRKRGVAVFWGSKAASITHVAYLEKPVDPNKPEGDWYILEARGVSWGVVRTRLLTRKPNYWGYMDKYFDYDDPDYVPSEPALGEIILKNGMMDRSDVKEMQGYLLELGYDLGIDRDDGDFGDRTEMALMKFQKAHGCEPDGEYGPITHAALMKAIEEKRKAETVVVPKEVKIEGGDCWMRKEPIVNAENKITVIKRDTVLEYANETGDNGWLKVKYKDQIGWVSNKYGKLI